MGIFRKATSVGTLGAVNYRSNRERTARAAEATAKHTKKAAKAQRQAAAAAQAQARAAQQAPQQYVVPVAADPRAPGWKPDPAGRYELRYWDGAAWTATVSTGGTQMNDPTFHG